MTPAIIYVERALPSLDKATKLIGIRSGNKYKGRGDLSGSPRYAHLLTVSQTNLGAGHTGTPRESASKYRSIPCPSRNLGEARAMNSKGKDRMGDRADGPTPPPGGPHVCPGHEAPATAERFRDLRHFNMLAGATPHRGLTTTHWNAWNFLVNPDHHSARGRLLHTNRDNLSLGCCLRGNHSGLWHRQTQHCLPLRPSGPVLRARRQRPSHR